MKPKILALLSGPVGVAVKPILAGIIGLIVAGVYQAAWVYLYKVPALAKMAEDVIAQLDPATVALWTPEAVGTATAALIWGFGADWVIARFKGAMVDVQDAINGSEFPATVKRDGIATKGGETLSTIKRALSIASTK